jgi:hypothetical protein
MPRILQKNDGNKIQKVAYELSKADNMPLLD